MWRAASSKKQSARQAHHIERKLQVQLPTDANLHLPLVFIHHDDMCCLKH